MRALSPSSAPPGQSSDRKGLFHREGSQTAVLVLLTPLPPPGRQHQPLTSLVGMGREGAASPLVSAHCFFPAELLSALVLIVVLVPDLRSFLSGLQNLQR